GRRAHGQYLGSGRSGRRWTGPADTSQRKDHRPLTGTDSVYGAHHALGQNVYGTGGMSAGLEEAPRRPSGKRREGVAEAMGAIGMRKIHGVWAAARSVEVRPMTTSGCAPP